MRIRSLPDKTDTVICRIGRISALWIRCELRLHHASEALQEIRPYRVRQLFVHS